MKQMGVEMIKALPRHPQTGGRYETFHKTITSILDSVLTEEPHLDVADGLAKAYYIYK